MSSRILRSVAEGCLWSRFWLPALVILWGIAATPAAELPANLLQAIQQVKQEGPASARARAAWEQVVAQGPGVLPQVLGAMNTSDTVVANWLRTAFDRIVDQDLQAGGKGIDVDALLAVVQDGKQQGRVRRLALGVVEEMKPGTTKRLTPGWLGDAEFGHEAVAAILGEADQLAKDGKKEEALGLYRKAFASCLDVGQAQTLRSRLKDLGVDVSVADHMGFLTDWYLIGPLDAGEMKGFKKAYPPEERIDLAAELPGKNGPVKWQRYQVKEAQAGSAARVALVNVAEAVGNADDAVAYAYTAFAVPRRMEIEFRGAADDNFQVWVNGKRVFGFEEYRNGVRLDRHRFKVSLQPGVNQVLVKVVQAPVYDANPAPNWEFLLRIAEANGKGIPFKNVLPSQP